MRSAVLALCGVLALHGGASAAVWEDGDGFVKTMTFSSISASETNVEKSAWRATEKVTYGYSAGKKVDAEIGYSPLLKAGCGAASADTFADSGSAVAYCNKTAFSDDALAANEFAMMRDAEDAITGAMSGELGTTSYIPIVGPKGVRIFSIVQNGQDFVDVVEYDYKTGKPSPKTRMSNTAAGGKLASAAEVGGSMSTWGTHLAVGANVLEMRLDYEGMLQFAHREAMGKGAISAITCMVDKKTCLYSLDNYLIMSVAKKAKDLSDVALYAAKFGSEDIEWLKLASNSETAQADARANWDKTEAELWDGETAKAGMEDIAARVLTAKAAAAAGATTLNNVKSLVAVVEAGKVFAAISNLDGYITQANRGCGAIVEMKIGAFEVTTQDEDGEDVTKVVTSYAVTGHALLGDLTSAGSACGADKIQAPLSIAYGQYHNTLFVGEGLESGESSVWAYDVDGKALARVLQFPSGFKAASLLWSQNFVGDARSFLFATAHSTSGVGQTGFLGPFRMPGYTGGSSDILPNLGLPLWEASQPNAPATAYPDNL